MHTQPAAHFLTHAFPRSQHKALDFFAWMVIGSLLIALSSKVQLPFPPVPFTMQSYVVLVLAMAMGFRLATATVLLYLAEGAMGLPVFASGAGLGYMMGPTGGYLLGFLVSAMTVGYLADRGFDKKITTSLIAMALGTAVLFFFGVSWLANLIGVEKALNVGLFPFWFGMLFKLILGALTLPLAWQLIKR